jgi:hypothetical protein
MARAKSGEKTRVHIWLDAEDVEEVRALYGQTIGFSKAIQTMVSRSLKHIRARAAEQGKALPVRGDEVPE